LIVLTSFLQSCHHYSFYYSAAAADDLKTKLKLSGLQLDFIQKLSKFLVGSILSCMAVC